VGDVPFGFGPDDDDRRPGENDPGSGDGAESGKKPVPTGGDPFSALFGAAGGAPQDLGAAFQRLGQLLSWQGGPVNWDLARDVARQAVAAAGDRSVSGAERMEVADAMRLAELWLDAATALPAGATSASAWSRAEWVEATLPAWKAIVDPVAAKAVESMGAMLSGDSGPMSALGAAPEQLQALLGATGPLQQMMTSIGGAMFGSQIGQALGSLATEVVGSTDVGLPLSPPGKAALLPQNVTAFGEGLGVPEDQVRLYLALREAAHHRLFAHVPWLRGHLVDAVSAYARGITIDTSRLEELVERIDPANPEAMQEALAGGLFEPEDTPEQKAALARLETALALVEGWVDEVVDTAATPHLPSAGALRETVRRRRASGGPAEATFASLVGLELRPRRLREAAALWNAVTAARGVDGRDAIWSHPDLLPTGDDLDAPADFASGASSTPLDLSGLDDTTAPEDPGAAPGTPDDKA
jgi:putative hydrolase